MLIPMERPNKVAPVIRRMEEMRNAMLAGGATYEATARAVNIEYGVKLAQAKEEQLKAQARYDQRFAFEGRVFDKVGYGVILLGIFVAAAVVGILMEVFA